MYGILQCTLARIPSSYCPDNLTLIFMPLTPSSLTNWTTACCATLLHMRSQEAILIHNSAYGHLWFQQWGQSQNRYGHSSHTFWLTVVIEHLIFLTKEVGLSSNACIQEVSRSNLGWGFMCFSCICPLKWQDSALKFGCVTFFHVLFCSLFTIIQLFVTV